MRTLTPTRRKGDAVTIQSAIKYAAVFTGILAALAAYMWQRTETMTAQRAAQRAESERDALAEQSQRQAAELDKLREAHARASESFTYYVEKTKKAEAAHDEITKKFKDLREDGDNGGWIDTQLPDGVCDILRELDAGSHCN